MKKSILRFLIVSVGVTIFSLLSISTVYAGTPTLEMQTTLSDGLTWFGFARKTGDINGDGYIDLITDNGYFGSGTGRLYVYFGGDSPDTTPDIVITGEATNNYFANGGDGGAGVDVADVNNDGFDDILVSAYGYNSFQEGKLYLFYGSASLLGNISATSADISSIGNLTDKKMIGVSVAFVDVNGDTFIDIVVATPTDEAALYKNKFHIFINDNGSFNLDNADIVISTTNTYWLGVMGINVADFDGDGKQDLLAVDSYGTGGHGMFLIKGPLTNSSTPTALFTSENGTADTFFRFGADSIGDINKDGKTDFCASSMTYSSIAANQGRVYCWYGSNSFATTEPAANADMIFDGFAAGDNFGRTTYLADVNNDGNLDLLVGAYQINYTAGSRHGKFFIYKGNGTSFSSTPWISEIKTAGNTAFGNGTFVFDWDKDGWPNISVMQGGSTSGGVGPAILNLYELSHGTPSINIGTSNLSVVSGTATDVGVNIAGVQWSTSNNPASTWYSCTPSDGTFDSLNEGYSCDISSLVTGIVYTIYTRSFDENDMYMPQKMYALVQIDKKAPSINITNLGLISNIPDKTPLFYYFTSQTPTINGKTEANATVHFKYGSNDYTTVADSSGNYTIDIPELPRQYVTLEYYALDQAGNQSETRKLNLMIGEENFPKELGEQTGSVTPSISVTPTPVITRQPTVEPEQTPQSYELIIVDQGGNPIPNAPVFINDQKYTANANGKVYIEKQLPKDAKIYVEIKGVKRVGNINGSKVIVEVQEEKTMAGRVWSWWWVIVLVAAGVGMVVSRMRKTRAAASDAKRSVYNILFIAILIVSCIKSDRVFAISETGTPATIAIGQSNLTNPTAFNGGSYLSGESNPYSAPYVYGGKLFIPGGNSPDIKIWNTIPTVNNTPPNIRIGVNEPYTRGNFTSTGLYYYPVNTFFDGTNFYVADRQNNRVLIYTDGIPTQTDQTADIVLGQPDMNSNTANNGGIGADTFNNPYGIWSNGTKLIISDYGNRRVLIWNTIPTANKAPADLVIGQINMTTSASGTSATAYKGPRGVFVDDATGKLLVADYDNHRVLIYNTIPTSNTAAADVVIGQVDMMQSLANQGGSVAANTLKYPAEAKVFEGKLYLGDSQNNRLLIYNTVPLANNAAADTVVGQADMTHGSANQGGSVGANTLGYCYGAIVYDGKMVVNDYTNHRTLIFNTVPISNNASADVVLGQADMASNAMLGGGTPSSTRYAMPEGASYDGGKLAVLDYANHRVLLYNSLPTANNAEADTVIGQANMTTASAGTTANKLFYAIDVNLNTEDNKLVIADYGNNRVLVFNTIPTVNNANADVVIGQSNMTSNTANSGGLSGKSLYYPHSAFYDSQSKKLFVADFNNNRVLIYNTLPTSNFASADVVVGQPDMTSNTANNGGLGPNTLNRPESVYARDGKLYITDYSNNRVLIYNTIPTSNFASADVVIGQPNMTSNAINNGGIGANTLFYPGAVSSDGKRIYISDSGNSRVLIYNTIPSANGAAADVVLGQNSYSGQYPGYNANELDMPMSAQLAGDKIMVMDYGNSRVLLYPTGPQHASVSNQTTTTTSIKLKLNADDAKQVMVSENSSFAGASWQKYNSDLPFTISSGYGTHTVYVKMRDYAEFESGVITSKVTLVAAAVSNSELTEKPTVTETVNEEETIQTIRYIVTDSNGVALANATIFIDGQDYQTDNTGNVLLTEVLSDSNVLEIIVDGKRVKGELKGVKIVVESMVIPTQVTKVLPNTSIHWLWWLLALSAVGATGVFVYVKRKNR